MYCCAKCGALIDLGGTEEDCPRGCYDTDDEDTEEKAEENKK